MIRPLHASGIQHQVVSSRLSSRVEGARKPLASLSLDLDNQWSYMKTHGDPGWETLPSYLDIVIPRSLSILHRHQLRITYFLVGLDAAQQQHHSVLRSIVSAGHEVGNHSYQHEPWLHLYSENRIEKELQLAEDAIEDSTGVRPTGFRGPGFSFSPPLLRVLTRRGYQYDASTFPTFLGPVARTYYFATSQNLSEAERRQRSRLFGKFSEGFRSLKPYQWQSEEGSLLEIPVTTLPLLKTPLHLSYLLYLACYSRFLAKSYFRWAIRLCHWTNTELSLLLHPLDFLSGEDVPVLSFFPAMKLPTNIKLDLVDTFFRMLTDSFTVLPMGEHATQIMQRSRLPRRSI